MGFQKQPAPRVSAYLSGVCLPFGCLLTFRVFAYLSGVCLPFGCLPTFRVSAYLSGVCQPFGCLPTFRVLVLLAGVSLAQRGAHGPSQRAQAKPSVSQRFEEPGNSSTTWIWPILWISQIFRFSIFRFLGADRVFGPIFHRYIRF